MLMLPLILNRLTAIARRAQALRVAPYALAAVAQRHNVVSHVSSRENAPRLTSDAQRLLSPHARRQLRPGGVIASSGSTSSVGDVRLMLLPCAGIAEAAA